MSRFHRAIALLCLMSMSISGFAYIKHEVKRGETLWGLSHKYNVSPDEITKLNPDAEKGLKTGMVLLIPDGKEDNEQIDGTQNDSQRSAGAQNNSGQNNDTQNEVVQKIDDVMDSMASTLNGLSSVTSIEMVDINSLPSKTNPETDISARPADTVIDGNLYIARFGDTLAGISAKTGVAEEELIRFNPFLDPSRVAEGTVVRLSEQAPYMTPNVNLSVVDSIVMRVTPNIGKVDKQDKNLRTIAVMLPFDVESEVISRQSLLATEFYKGFMIATHKATERRDMPIRIIAIDTQCDSIEFDDRLNQLLDMNVSVIIPPDDEQQLEKIEDFALNNNALVLNVLNIKDEGYVNRPNVIQCNISQKIMYDKAIKTLLNDFADYTPVILDLAGGKDEKMSFIDELRQQYDAIGRKVVNLSFKNRLEPSDLETLDRSKKYVFIPKSGSIDVFNKISETLTSAVEDNIADDRYKVFGYPDWIAFRGEQEEALHRMGANIYSRFYYDTSDFRNEDINQEFVKWYGTVMEEVFPSQGLLGYDAGSLLFGALQKKYITDDIAKFKSGSFDGVQSSFKFTYDDSGDNGSAGLINETLYIIEYLPGQVLYVKTI